MRRRGVPAKGVGRQIKEATYVRTEDSDVCAQKTFPNVKPYRHHIPNQGNRHIKIHETQEKMCTVKHTSSSSHIKGGSHTRDKRRVCAQEAA